MKAISQLNTYFDTCFAEPLCYKTKVDMSLANSWVYIEILFKCNGLILDKIGPVTLDIIYDMIQK